MTPTPTRRLGAVLLSSVAAAVAAGTLSAPAEAAPARDLKPVITRYKASVDACKVVLDGGAKVRLFAQLDNTRNTGRNVRSGAVYVMRDGDDLGKSIQLPLTKAGKKSKVKSVTFGTGGKVELGVGIGTGRMGDGTTIPLKRVRAC